MTALCTRGLGPKDGTGVRDYIHVMDLAEGHVAALRYMGPEAKVRLSRTASQTLFNDKNLC